jgi:hypothetical protein
LPFNSSEASHAAHVPPHDDPGLESFFIPGPLAMHFSSSFSPIVQGPSIQAPSSQTTLLDSRTSLQGLPKNISGCYLMKSNSQPQFLSFLELIPAERASQQPATEDAMAGLQAFLLSPEESMSAVSIINTVRQESMSADATFTCAQDNFSISSAGSTQNASRSAAMQSNTYIEDLDMPELPYHDDDARNSGSQSTSGSDSEGDHYQRQPRIRGAQPASSTQISPEDQLMLRSHHPAFFLLDNGDMVMTDYVPSLSMGKPGQYLPVLQLLHVNMLATPSICVCDLHATHIMMCAQAPFRLNTVLLGAVRTHSPAIV